MSAELFYDLGSPYGYLAVARAPAVLGSEPVLVPVLLGAIFAERGHGSWAHTGARDENVAEVERRAHGYGLPPVAWPPGWPPNTLAAMRTATWARGLGDRGAFATAAYRLAFVEGRDLAQLEAVVDAAAAAGLPAEELPAAIARQEVKDELRRTTDEAWRDGVIGVPCVRVGQRIFYGDDRLEEAAAALKEGHG